MNQDVNMLALPLSAFPAELESAVWGRRSAVTGYQDPLKPSKSSMRTLFQHLIQ